MAVRKAHGRAKNLGAVVVVETPGADELAAASTAAHAGPVERHPDGRLTAAGARMLGRRGAMATNRRKRLAAELADQLGLATIPESLKPYIAHAREFARAQLTRLTDAFGEVGPGPSSMVQSAALALAASRAAYASGDASKGASLAEKSRQTLLTAHHVADLEAKAKPTADDEFWLEGADR